MSRTPALAPEHFTSFGELLKFLRRRAGLSQRELSIAVGYSESQISRLEQNQRPPDEAAVAARFVPALALESERAWVARLLALAAVAKSGAQPNQLSSLLDSGATARPEQEAPAPSHNLPLQLTSFIGREQELTEITRLLMPGSQPYVVRLLAEDSPSSTPRRGGAVRPQRGRRGVGGPQATDMADAPGVRPGVQAVRLLTLTGPGGTGKTRLSLQVAAEVLDQFPDGVWFVELAPLADPAFVPQTVALALSVREQPGRPIQVTLADHLRDKHLLLVLDNCEHLIQASAQLADVLLHACPRLRILATSREFLGVAGERVFYVSSLSTPDQRALPPLEALIRYEAVRLFCERAVNVSPAFALTLENATTVTQLCRRLDGIPLAIELAAARLRMLPVEQIAVRLDDRFHLLTGGSRTAPPRHQTLQALIDWSYELLPEAERVLLNRLAVFAAGWTLEAAQAVGAGAGVTVDSVFELLSHLVDKSLVLAEPQGTAARYRMLETIRQYALAKLSASGEVEAVRRRHAEYFLALAEPGRRYEFESLPLEWVKRVAQEQDNLRAALAWSLSANGDADMGLRLATAWRGLGYWSEGRSWLQSALAHPDAINHPHARAYALNRLAGTLTILDDYATAQTLLEESRRLLEEIGGLPTRAWVLNRLGWLARERGDFATARLRLEESLALCRELGDKSGIISGLSTLGEVAVMQEDAAEAALLLEECLALSREQNDKDGISWALNHLGHVARLRGENRRATSLDEESLVLFRASGVLRLGIAEVLQSLGETALAEGNAALATRRLTEAVDLFQQLGRRAGIAWCLAGLAGAAALDEEMERAARLWGAAETLRQAIGARYAPASRATRERLMAAVRAQLGDARFDAAWAEGQATTLPEQVMQIL